MPVFARQLGSLNYSSPEAVKSIANHIRSMQEQLEYRLSCLDSSNISEINMDETNIISKDGSLISILNSYGEQMASIMVSYDSITATVADQNGKISSLEQTVDGFSAIVADQNGKIAALQLSVDGFSTSIAEAKQYTDEKTGEITASLVNYSTIEQTATAISSAIVSYDTNTLSTKYSTISQTNSKIEATVTSCNEYTDEKTGDLADTISTTLSVEEDGVYIYQSAAANYLKLTSKSIELYGSVMGYTMQYLAVEAAYGSYESGANAASNNFYAKFYSTVGNAQMAFETMSFPEIVTFGSSGKVYFKGDVDFSAASITGSYLTFS